MEGQGTNSTAAGQQEKTFTQEQVNAIVGKRLAEQKQQLDADLVKRERELNRREMGIKARELLAGKGLPESLAGVLRYETEDELVKAIDAIEHAKGFKPEGEKREKRIYQECRLETRGAGGEFHDPIGEAFGLKK